jgi:hypothetical protein
MATFKGDLPICRTTVSYKLTKFEDKCSECFEYYENLSDNRAAVNSRPGVAPRARGGYTF